MRANLNMPKKQGSNPVFSLENDVKNWGSPVWLGLVGRLRTESVGEVWEFGEVFRLDFALFG